MSRKRNHEQMSNAKDKEVVKSKPSSIHKSLLDTLEQVENSTVIVQLTDCPRTWTVSRALLRDNSKRAAREMQDPAIKSIVIYYCRKSSGLELFLQWLYLGSYEEHDGFATSLSEGIGNLSVEHDVEPGNMRWSVKAALVAHHFGWWIDAFDFQDYAMSRLKRAYDIDEPKAMITPDIVHYHRYETKVSKFLEDTLIRNWGDKTVVDHELEAWSRVFENEALRKKFLQAMATPLEVRRQKPVALEEYLLKAK